MKLMYLVDKGKTDNVLSVIQIHTYLYIFKKTFPKDLYLGYRRTRLKLKKKTKLDLEENWGILVKTGNSERHR